MACHPASEIRSKLDRLVAGMTGLRTTAGFHEPNLDGTAGDYISFDAWEWPQGVGLYGLVRLWQFTGRDDLRQLVENWYAAPHRGRPAAAQRQHHRPDARRFPCCGRRPRDPRWQPVLDAWAEPRDLRDGPRTAEGGFEHHVSDKVNDNELWDDTLFMVGAVPRQLRAGAAGRRELVDEAARQFLVHAHYLADTRDRPLVPRLDLRRPPQFRRGPLGARQCLDHRRHSRPSRPRRDRQARRGLPARRARKRRSTRCCRCRRRPAPGAPCSTTRSSYEEISATAGFGYGLLKGSPARPRHAGLAAQAGLRALEAVLDNIDDDGTVLNVSYGTRMGHDLQFYRDIPIQPTGYGQALAILCLSEALHHVEAEGGGGMTMRVLYGAAPEDIAGYDTDRLRDDVPGRGLFEAGEVRFIYTHVDRLILGGAVPTAADARLRRRR